jgi:hypothetical protein
MSIRGHPQSAYVSVYSQGDRRAVERFYVHVDEVILAHCTNSLVL